MPVPLAVPAAVGIYELAALAAASITALWLASPQGRQATTAAANQLSEALSRPRSEPMPLAPSIPRACPRERDSEDKCGPLIQRIYRVMAELRRRIAEMEVDRYNLYEIRPQALPGIGSWPGHVLQFKLKQAHLRRLLQEASTYGCPTPAGAWKLATRNPPKHPKRS